MFNSDESCRQLFSENKRESLSLTICKNNIQQQAGALSGMAQVAEADHEAEDGEDELNNKRNHKVQRQRRIASHYEDSLSPGKNDVSCFLDLLNGDNSNGEVEELLVGSNNDNDQP